MGLSFCLVSVAVAFFEFKSGTPVTALITYQMFSLAMGDVAVDGLVVCQQRLDPKNGSEDL